MTIRFTDFGPGVQNRLEKVMSTPHGALFIRMNPDIVSFKIAATRGWGGGERFPHFTLDGKKLHIDLLRVSWSGQFIRNILKSGQSWEPSRFDFYLLDKETQEIVDMDDKQEATFREAVRVSSVKAAIDREFMNRSRNLLLKNRMIDEINTNFPGALSNEDIEIHANEAVSHVNGRGIAEEEAIAGVLNKIRTVRELRAFPLAER